MCLVLMTFQKLGEGGSRLERPNTIGSPAACLVMVLVTALQHIVLLTLFSRVRKIGL